VISKLELENFQGFKGAQTVRLAPITLIFGANSSGKSSIARAVNFLISAKSSTKADATTSRNSVMPNYPGLLFGQNPVTTEESWLGVTATLSGQLAAADYCEVKKGVRVNTLSDEYSLIYGVVLSEEAISKNFERNLASHVSAQNQLAAFVEELLADEYLNPSKWLKAVEDSGRSQENYRLMYQNLRNDLGDAIASLQDSSYEKQLHQSVCFQFSSLHGFSMDNESLSSISGELRLLGLTHEENSTEVNSTEPWTPSEARWWIHENKVLVDDDSGGDYDWLEPDGVERRLIDVVDTVNSRTEIEINSFRFVDPIRKAPGQVSEVVDATSIHSETLERMNFALMRLTDQRYSYEIRELDSLPFSKIQTNLVRDHFTSTVLNFEDVGSGLSQILPILKAIFANSYGALYVEQPELHLHPKMQSDFMDIFIDEFTREENHRENQFIIETHSESMLLRLQKRIREGVLSPEDVCILFTDVSQESAEDSVISRFNTVSEIKLDHLGDVIDPLPISFVNLRIEDLL
jgi:energy-coupling factor transporter ATP-binding protein EcfA2